MWRDPSQRRNHARPISSASGRITWRSWRKRCGALRTVRGYFARLQLAPSQRCRRPYQFRHMLKHVNMKPPIIMPDKMASKSLPDNQASTIPPTAVLASNQKNHIASLKRGLRSCGKIVLFPRNRGEPKPWIGVRARTNYDRSSFRSTDERSRGDKATLKH
jgi:hypothetical protein